MKTERVTDTIILIPSSIPIPAYDAEVHLQQAVEYIISLLLKNPLQNFLCQQQGMTPSMLLVLLLRCYKDQIHVIHPYWSN